MFLWSHPFLGMLPPMGDFALIHFSFKTPAKLKIPPLEPPKWQSKITKLSILAMKMKHFEMHENSWFRTDSGSPKSTPGQILQASLKPCKNNRFGSFGLSWSASRETILSRNRCVRNVSCILIISRFGSLSSFPKSIPKAIFRATPKRYKNNGFGSFWLSWSASREQICSRNHSVRNVSCIFNFPARGAPQDASLAADRSAHFLHTSAVISTTTSLKVPKS